MRQGRGGQQIGRARPGGGRAEHETAAQMVFGVSRRRKPHALFILPAIQRQIGPRVVQRLTETGDIAMPEDPEAPTANTRGFTFNLNILRGQITYDRLCRGQADCFRDVIHKLPFRYAPRQLVVDLGRTLTILVLQPVANIIFGRGA